MRPFIASSENKKSAPLYIQLYRHIKAEILSGEMSPGEKLPSLRKMASDSGVSLITSGRAYDQLLTEGYITSRPQSGYYVASLPESATSETARRSGEMDLSVRSADASPYICDEAAFDFGKWKKCTSRVLNDYSHLLLFESDVQGEEALRYEISKYVYSSRGVTASPDRIVIGAGTQQLTAHLCRILSRMGIGYICTEDPGYLPLQQVFRDNGFTIGKIPVSREGIRLDKLPVNIPAAVYVSPANQFPTGSVMPIGNRYRLLAWARDNDSYILEDDYDSELRYFGRPIPALQGLDENDRVVYLGSFSSTLF
ncbi:MAG: PLP-dependent aminotransferase family protein, partial [Firmicutes bacterium]|nr:PLP-dependent aminotransferase family protein [Bacillota bacterium]